MPAGAAPRREPSGNASAEAELRLAKALRDHYRLVWRTLRGLGVWPAVLDDATQQVFLTFAAKLRDVPPATERAFLAQVAVRIAANVRRSQQRRREDAWSGDDYFPDPSMNPEALLGAKQERQELQRLLNEMPEEQRAVFILYELEGMTLIEIAEALGVPQGTAASRLRRARGRFRARVGEPPEPSQGGAP